MGNNYTEEMIKEPRDIYGFKLKETEDIPSFQENFTKMLRNYGRISRKIGRKANFQGIISRKHAMPLEALITVKLHPSSELPRALFDPPSI